VAPVTKIFVAFVMMRRSAAVVAVSQDGDALGFYHFRKQQAVRKDTCSAVGVHLGR
jgi:hypothetical protein